MKKICLTVVGMYLVILNAFSQQAPKDTTAYKSRKLRTEEVSIVSSYYTQKADKSAVMGGRTDPKGNGDVTDFSNSIELKLAFLDSAHRKNNITFGMGYDHHTAASQGYIDSNGHARNNGTRLYPTLDWSRENKIKGSEVGLGLYFSHESQYYNSLGFNGSVSQKTRNNGEFSVKVSAFLDKIHMINPAEFNPPLTVTTVAPTDSVVYITTASGHRRALVYHNGGSTTVSGQMPDIVKSRNTISASFSFAQVINERLQASIAMDLVYMKGYLGLPFHRVYLNTGKDTIETLPSSRFKLPIGLRMNYFVGDKLILRAFYRYYLDSWGLRSHTASLETAIKLTPFFSLSPYYRFYRQTAAKYFAPYATHTLNDEYYTSNYALAAFTSHAWGMGLRLAPPKGVLMQSLAALELRYGHYSQTTNLVSNVISIDLKFK